ncbi:MAG TPA: hypothetical protein VMB85_11885 [Bryobacteraceae bacterium]|nr:hypothetical protein [Bryobacteraceae bacterium]
MELKLKQASAVLGVDPKDLQNLVQFKVLRPRRRDSLYLFDNRVLLQAKVAFYLKESLGTSTELLALFTRALSRNLIGDEDVAARRYVWLQSRPAASREPIEVRIPLRDLAKELEEQLPRAEVYRDLPRGRKRSEWKLDFVRSLQTAAGELGGITESQIVDAVRGYRAAKKRPPEITVGAARK